MGPTVLKSTPNDRFFEKLFMAILFLLTEFLPEICWEEIAEEILFVFYFDVRPGALRLTSQHTTYYTTATALVGHSIWQTKFGQLRAMWIPYRQGRSLEHAAI